MANVIKLKKSIVAGNIPTTANLALGEGAINHTDQKIYFRHPGTGVVWNFAGGSITTGPVDNSILRANGTSGATLQNSGLIVEDAIVSITGITGDALTDVITATGSAFANGQPVRFTALTGGTGLNTTTNYFVRDVSGATFKLETSIGGGAINFTTNITAGTLLTGHSVSTNVTLSENTTATNSDLVLTPKGTGAFILGSKPDGTATAGNARGTYAVDLQISKGSATAVASGQYSFLGGGSGNASSSVYSVVVGGYLNSASGGQSVVVGGGKQSDGAGNTASGESTGILGGIGSLADRRAMQSHASGRFAANGDAQRARFVLRCKTTTNTAVEMALDGATTRLTIPSGKYLTGTINIAGIKSDGSATASYIRQFSIKNVAATTTLVGTVNTIGIDQASLTSISITANDASDFLSVQVTGILSETWRWVASVDVVEVAYGV
jgi:hypothetical protein